MNHARRLADGDWTGADSDEEAVEVDRKEEQQEKDAEDDGMEIERKKLPKYYANQVRAIFLTMHYFTKKRAHDLPR